MMDGPGYLTLLNGRKQTVTTCPTCSHKRTKKRERCLTVTSVQDGGVVWCCHHCNDQGSYFPDPKRRGPQPAKPAFTLRDRQRMREAAFDD